MPQAPVPQEAASLLWNDCLVNKFAVIVTLILFLIEVSDLIRLFPQLLRCISRWKGNLELEHSVNQARTRNTLAMVMAMVLCIILDRWAVLPPSFKTSLPAEWQLAVSAALIGGYVLLRRILYLFSRFRSRTAEYDQCLQHSVYNYQILLTSLMLPTALLMTAFSPPEATMRVVLLVESAVFSLLHLLRSGQIFASRCSTLATILYLCALEILPLGILIFVCTL